jgi:hypothetical protein
MTETAVPLDYVNLRARGFTLPKSDVSARLEAQRVASSVENRKLISAMRGSGSAKTAANTTMALPKVRQPMSSLSDKKIPYEVSDPEQLKEIRRWARLFYTTHNLIPLLIDIYAKFPIQGFEIQSKDPQIKEFYESMFFESLDYETFLQDFGREFFIAGEVNSLAHFNESLGIWSSEEILNPDNIHVTKSLFRDGERVQLLVKELVDAIKNDAISGSSDLTPSERLEKNHEYAQLVRDYPEMVQAAASGDGLDISDALISRVVNKTNAWDVRGTPHMLRCFRDLMMEESLNSAQDAVADRLYSPMILATLGIQNLGDDSGPWIPTPADLDETRDMLQQAIAADFRLITHHMGLDIKSVFGRESVPRFDQDFTRIDRKIMSAWGIGDALISGSASGTYASSALNREFVTQMMNSYQKNVRKHMRKRMEVIAEAQGHFDYELSGGRRKPIYRNIIEVDPETGKEYVRKVPKLLIPDVQFQTLNLRDEAQERSFLQALKNNGVPISDESLMVNIEFDFKEEIEKQANETVQKLVAESQAMKKALQIITEQGNPIPPELAKFFAAGEQLKAEQEKTRAESERADAIKEVKENGGVIGDGQGNLLDIGDADWNSGSGLGDQLDPDSIEDQVDNSKDPDGKVYDMGLQPRNRTRPAESDEHRSTQPKAASTEEEEFDPSNWAFGRPPSTFGASHRMDPKRVEAAVAGFEHERDIRVLVSSDDFFDALNQTHLADQIRNDIDEIDRSLQFTSDGETRLASSDPHVKESFDLLQDMMDQYEGVYGYRPEF